MPKDEARKTALQDKRQEELLLIRAKRQKAELELSLARGQLIDRSEQEARETRIASEIRKHLLSIPRSNADRLAHLEPREVEAELQAIVRDLMDVLHRAQASKKGKARAKRVGAQAVSGMARKATGRARR